MTRTPIPPATDAQMVAWLDDIDLQAEAELVHGTQAATWRQRLRLARARIDAETARADGLHVKNTKWARSFVDMQQRAECAEAERDELRARLNEAYAEGEDTEVGR